MIVVTRRSNSLSCNTLTMLGHRIRLTKQIRMSAPSIGGFN